MLPEELAREGGDPCGGSFFGGYFARKLDGAVGVGGGPFKACVAYVDEEEIERGHRVSGGGGPDFIHLARLTNNFNVHRRAANLAILDR